MNILVQNSLLDCGEMKSEKLFLLLTEFEFDILEQ